MPEKPSEVCTAWAAFGGADTFFLRGSGDSSKCSVNACIEHQNCWWESYRTSDYEAFEATESILSHFNPEWEVWMYRVHFFMIKRNMETNSPSIHLFSQNWPRTQGLSPSQAAPCHLHRPHTAKRLPFYISTWAKMAILKRLKPLLEERGVPWVGVDESDQCRHQRAVLSWT